MIHVLEKFAIKQHIYLRSEFSRGMITVLNTLIT